MSLCSFLRDKALLGVVAGLHLCCFLPSSHVCMADQGMARLLRAYPEQLCAAEGNTLVWCDGSAMPYDDGKGPKSHAQKLQDPDLQEQMEQAYPRGASYPSPPPADFEPGRIRNEAFFKKMYGRNAEEVQKNLTSLVWMPKTSGQRVRVTTMNGVHRHLQAVSEELDRLPENLKRFVDRPAGAFNWRVIAAEKRLSPHSFGIALDINAATGDYWLWNIGASGRLPAYRNRIPMEIVLIFEKHGFIWGGKWSHYDTLHFEYRPELLNDFEGLTTSRRLVPCRVQ